jgi:hypothetical protein
MATLAACAQSKPTSHPAFSSNPISFTGPATFVPDLSLTPGKLCTPDDPDFVEYRYDAQIPYCQRSVTNAEKAQVAAGYNVDPADWSQYEFDHLIPLSLGGSDDPSNIWPQRLDAAREKDKLETQLYNQLKNGQITQDDAVQQILAWKM